MSSASLLSFYPTHQILDEVLAIKNYKNVIVYLDLKNNLQTTYMEHAVINILESSKSSRYLDTSIFSSLLSFLGWHKQYALKKGINIHFVIFFETGRSFYHQSIYKMYKVSRRVDELYGLDRNDRELFTQTLQNNFKLIEKAGNQLPGTTVIRMENFEADFIPYYLTTRELVPMDDSVLHLVYSNDHDLWQCARNNVYLYSKTPTAKKIIRENQAMSLILKQECNLPDSYLPLAMSILGDPGDDVPGVKGVGPKRLYPMLNEIIDLVGDMNQVYESVRNGSGLFNGIDKEIKNKYLNSVIEDEKQNQTVSRNLKLVSFELISRFLDEPTSTESLQKKRYIESILDNDCKTSKDLMKPALEKCGVFIENDSLDYIYT